MTKHPCRPVKQYRYEHYVAPATLSQETTIRYCTSRC